MAKTFFERVKAFITKPSKAFENERKTSVGNALKYGLIGVLFLAIGFSVITSLTMLLNPSTTGFGTLSIIFVFVMMLFVGFLGILGGSLWYHLWAYIFGARQGLGNTIKAMYFAYTPTYFLGWIPFVNFVVGIWSLVLLGIGLKKLQKLSTGRAVGAILATILIPLIIVIIIMLWLLATFGPEIFANNQTTSAFSIPY